MKYRLTDKQSGRQSSVQDKKMTNLHKLL